MARQEQSETWQEIKEIWGKSSQGETIYFEFSKLINELKNNMSQWEKDSIKSDVAKIKSSWDQLSETFKITSSKMDKEDVH